MSREILKRLGYQVQCRLDPQDALALFQDRPDEFDLIIPDMAMPGMTGIKLSEEIRSVRPDIPIIICTGYRSLIDEKKATVMGIDGFVMKPVSRENLDRMIRKVLDHTDRMVV